MEKKKNENLPMFITRVVVYEIVSGSEGYSLWIRYNSYVMNETFTLKIANNKVNVI